MVRGHPAPAVVSTVVSRLQCNPAFDSRQSAHCKSTGYVKPTSFTSLNLWNTSLLWTTDHILWKERKLLLSQEICWTVRDLTTGISHVVVTYRHIRKLLVRLCGVNICIIDCAWCFETLVQCEKIVSINIWTVLSGETARQKFWQFCANHMTDTTFRQLMLRSWLLRS